MKIRLEVKNKVQKHYCFQNINFIIILISNKKCLFIHNFLFCPIISKILQNQNTTNQNLKPGALILKRRAEKISYMLLKKILKSKSVCHIRDFPFCC